MGSPLKRLFFLITPVLPLLFHPHGRSPCHQLYSALQNKLLGSERRQENDNDMEGGGFEVREAQVEKDSQVLLKAQIAVNHHVEVANRKRQEQEK